MRREVIVGGRRLRTGRPAPHFDEQPAGGDVVDCAGFGPLHGHLPSTDDRGPGAGRDSSTGPVDDLGTRPGIPGEVRQLLWRFGSRVVVEDEGAGGRARGAGFEGDGPEREAPGGGRECGIDAGALRKFGEGLRHVVGAGERVVRNRARLVGSA